MALVLKCALLIINKSKPQLRYVLSTLAMLMNLMLPIFTFGIIYLAQTLIVNNSVDQTSLAFLVHEYTPQSTFVTYKEITEALPLFLPYITLAWFISVFILASKLLIEMHNVNTLSKQKVIAPTQALLSRFNTLATQIGLHKAPRLLISLKIDVPMAIGWLKPVVLLPVSMITGLNNAQLEMLILHELAHIRRHDYLVNFIQTLVEILLFFHPSVQWVSKQMRNEREYCSDDIAVQHCGDAIAYAHTLTDTATICNKHRHHTIPNMAMAATGGDLKDRVVRLVNHHCAPSRDISKWVAATSILFLILFLSSKSLLSFPLVELWNNKASLHSKESENNITTLAANVPEHSLAQQLLTTANRVENRKPTTVSKINADTYTDSENDVIFTISGEKNSLTIAKMANQQTIQPKVNINHTGIDTDTSMVNATQLNIINKHALLESKANTELTINDIAKELPLPNHKKMAIAKQTTNTAVTSTHLIPITNKDAYPVLLGNKLDDGLNNNKTKSKGELAFERIDTTNLQSRINSPLVKQQSQHLAEPLRINQKNQLAENTTALEKRNIFKPTAVEPIWHSAEQLISVNPVYPSAAQRKRIEVEVKVNFTIDAQGQIKDIYFDPQSKASYFKSSIRTAIKKWRFLPAKIDDKPVESQMSKIFSFNLRA
ncbi:MAG: M56 family metallopeptidase [Colwellia sp.]